MHAYHRYSHSLIEPCVHLIHALPAVWMRMAAKGSRVAAKVSDVPGLMRGQAASFCLNIHGAQNLKMPGPAVFTQDRVPKIQNPRFSSRVAVTLFHTGTRRFLSRTWTSDTLSAIDSGSAGQREVSSAVS